MTYKQTQFDTINLLLMLLDKLQIITHRYNGLINADDLKDYI